MRKTPTILCLMLSASSLSGCGKAVRLPAFVAPAEIRLERMTVPDELLVCSLAPARLRAEPPPTNEDFARRYVAPLEPAGEDWSGRLAEIRKLIANPP